MFLILALTLLMSGACGSTTVPHVELKGAGYVAALKSSRLCSAFLRTEARESTQNICLCLEQHRKERDSRDNCYHDQGGKYLIQSCKIKCIRNPYFPYYGVFTQESDSVLQYLPKLTLLMMSQLITNPLARSIMVLFNIIQHVGAQEAPNLNIENWLTPFDRFSATEMSKDIDLRNLKEMLNDVLQIVYSDLIPYLDQSRIHEKLKNNNMDLDEHNSLFENIDKMLKRQQQLIVSLESYTRSHNLTLQSQAKQIEFHAARVSDLTEETKNISNNVNEYLMEIGVPGDLMSILAGTSFLIISIVATCLLAQHTILTARQNYLAIHFFK